MRLRMWADFYGNIRCTGAHVILRIVCKILQGDFLFKIRDQRVSFVSGSLAATGTKDSISDPRESHQGQKEWKKKGGFLGIVGKTKNTEHEAECDNIQDKSEQRRVRPGSGDNPKHKQNKKETGGQGQTPDHLEKKIGNDLERVTCLEGMFENERSRSRNQVRQ
jgi:hypothetical protein